MKKMQLQFHNSILVAITILSLLVLSASADEKGRQNLDMTDAAHLLSDSGLVGASGFADAANLGNVDASTATLSVLARADYQKVYDRAMALLGEGTQFRTGDLQLNTTTACEGKTGDDLDKCLQQNYKDFNGGPLFYRFCASFEPQSAILPQTETNLSGACRAWGKLSDPEQQARVPGGIGEQPPGYTQSAATGAGLFWFSRPRPRRTADR